MIKRLFNHLWRKILLLLVNKIFVGTNPHFFKIKRWSLQSIGFVIGENTKIVGPVVCTGSLIIGRDCWIGANFTVRGNGTVILGDRIDVGPDVTFITGTHQTGTSEHRAGEGYNCTQTIGNGCWIGAKSIFVNNISIGAACIVAASACVCKTFPANLLIGGVPAKAIKSLE